MSTTTDVKPSRNLRKLDQVRSQIEELKRVESDLGKLCVSLMRSERVKRVAWTSDGVERVAALETRVSESIDYHAFLDACQHLDIDPEQRDQAVRMTVSMPKARKLLPESELKLLVQRRPGRPYVKITGNRGAN